MAYEVTATRRRPQHFEDLAGQEYVAETLKNSIKTNQIAHAYLFTGPRGCGKTSTARILAKALNCQASEGPTCTPCGQCESCKAITNSSSLDVIEIDGASTNSVNDIRQIKDEVMFPPTASRYKIYIIDEVHMLSSGAFNALLKTIEEPPSHVIFIFATTELQKVPATIKSRCQQYNFRLVSIERLKNLLKDACSEMNIQANDEALYWIAKESGGSVRDCYTLFDQVAAFSEGNITYEKIRDKLGLLGIERLNNLFENASAGKAEETLNQLDDFLQSGISIEQIISNSSEYLRSLLLIKNGITKESLLGQSAERFSGKVLDSWNTIQTERALSIFMQLYRDIRYSLSPRYELELAFSKLCWLTQYVSPAEVKNAIDKAKALLENSNTDTNTSSASNSIQATSTSGFVSEKKDNLNQTTNNNYQTQENQREQENQTETRSRLPHFAFLENPPVRPEKTPDENSEGNANPFPDGGALPPEKTEAADNQTIKTTQEIPGGLPVFSALKKTNTNEVKALSSVQNIAPSNSSSLQYDYSDYGYAPEGEIPPEDENDYTETEEDLQEKSEQLLEEFNKNSQSEKDNPELIHASQECIVNPDGYSVTLEKIYGTLVAELSVNNAMLASALMETKKWFLDGQNKIKTSINSEYQKNFIQQNIPLINQSISRICQMPVNFEIDFQEQKKINTITELPLQVKLLCTAFKGSVVGGKL